MSPISSHDPHMSQSTQNLLDQAQAIHQCISKGLLVDVKEQ